MSTPEAQMPQPLTEADLQQIDQALGRSREAENLIARARQAGIDVGELETRNRDARERLRRIKGAFFPGR